MDTGALKLIGMIDHRFEDVATTDRRDAPVLDKISAARTS